MAVAVVFLFCHSGSARRLSIVFACMLEKALGYRSIVWLLESPLERLSGSPHVLTPHSVLGCFEGLAFEDFEDEGREEGLSNFRGAGFGLESGF